MSLGRGASIFHFLFFIIIYSPNGLKINYRHQNLVHVYGGRTINPFPKILFISLNKDLDIRGLGPDQIKGTAQNKTLMTNNSTKSLSSDSSIPISGSASESKRGNFKRSSSSKKTLDVVKEVDERKDEDTALYEIVGDQNAMNFSFGSEMSKISQKMTQMKQVKIDSIQRITSSLNDNYNPNDTLDSVLPNAEECVEDTFDEELVEDEAKADISSDSAMVIDGSASSDQNAQLELEISLRMTKIRSAFGETLTHNAYYTLFSNSKNIGLASLVKN